jgi:hypothetical protein
MISIENAAFERKNLFSRKFDVNMKNKLLKSYMWNTAFNGNTTYIFRRNRSELPWKFWNMALEKDGEDHLDWSCEKWRITKWQGVQEYATKNKKKEG